MSTVYLLFLLVGKEIVWGTVDHGRASKLAYWDKRTALAYGLVEARGEKQKYCAYSRTKCYTLVLYKTADGHSTVSEMFGSFLEL